MTNIEDLPPELLIHLFTYLTPEDRRIASLVCRYWCYEIWMTQKFARDRRLKFDFCNFTENSGPTKIFAQTEREYHELVFGGEARFCQKTKENFFENNFRGLKSLEFEQFFNYKQLFSYSNNFLSNFPELTELTLNFDTLQFTTKDFGALPKSIKTLNLVLHNSLYSKTSFNMFKGLVWDILHLKELNLECQLLTDDLTDFITTLQLSTLKSLKVTIDSTCYVNLFKLKCPNMTELFLVIEEPQIVQFLDEILSKFPALNVVKLHVFKTMPRSTYSHLIKYLKVTDLNCGMDYVKPLQFLTDLEELDLSYYFKSVAQGNCFFAHDPYLNPNLRKLRLCGFNNNDLISLMCFENLVKSYPNLEILEMDMPLSSQHLQMINQYFQKLKCLAIRNTDVDSRYVPPLKNFQNLTELHLEQYIFTNEALLEWPPMEHLRVLSIKLDHDYKLENFEKMIQNVRGVEKLTFNYSSEIGDELMGIVAENCKRLTEITVEKNHKTERLSEDVVKLLREKCLFLRKVSFPFLQVNKFC
ncbi:uncharacterized protein LOC134831175 [Culicoides brevitarsis]|uniref:uncharacterized protein LOC134831175 n=1 Tax=Culicoides brevitarsis TaxID=469753 RepID=UPI00307C7432